MRDVPEHLGDGSGRAVAVSLQRSRYELKEVPVLAELTFRVVYEYADDASLERHTKEAEDLMPQGTGWPRGDV
jgi:hypothetical protein